MHKIFLVDDEIIVRESIRSSIDWDQTNYSLVGEAPDGEMALSMMMDLKPDILLTDIRMPFMDGLALADIVKKNMPWVRIIILSGHDEFQYAKKAISLGVSAYLLKPISPDELLNTLDEVAAEIDEERLRKQSLEKLQHQLESSASARSERLLEDLITGALTTADAIEAARGQGVNLLARHYLKLNAKLTSGLVSKSIYCRTNF
ncbi:MAG: response regulator [Clostridiaceae bacterium]|nr:response regulator [Clostridiaceae bacterium]